MATILEKSVTKNEDGSWDFQCPGIVGSLCGELDGRPFHSDGWPTKKLGMARGEEHFADHLGHGPASSLEDFRVKHGLAADTSGKVTLNQIEGA